MLKVGHLVKDWLQLSVWVGRLGFCVTPWAGSTSVYVDRFHFSTPVVGMGRKDWSDTRAEVFISFIYHEVKFISYKKKTQTAKAI